MKSFMSAYVIGNSHIEEKVNVFNVKDLAISFCDLKMAWNFKMDNGTKWHNLKHRALN
jgi:hypothetical protein